MHERLQNIDIITLFTRDLIVIFTIHLQTVKNSTTNQFPSHPCLVSKDEELGYLRSISEVLVRVFAPKDVQQSSPTRLLLRELLVNSMFYYSANRFLNFDYINEYILYLCDENEKNKKISRGVYACAPPPAVN